MSDENDGDGLTECPVCGTPVFSIEVRGPTPAERYARPCGHRLPAEFDHESEPEPESESDDDGTELDSWHEQFNAHAGDGGGCLETAQAAASEREESRRGIAKGLSALLATFGLGTAASTPVSANPHAPGTPTVAGTYVCTGEIDIDCVAAAAGGTGGCYPCAAKPSHLTCVPCGAALVAAGILSRHECCVGGEWVSTRDGI
jgi:hypothetical protein